MSVLSAQHNNIITTFLSKSYHTQQPDGKKPVADKCDTEPAERIFISEENNSIKAESPCIVGKKQYGYASMTQEQIEG